MFKCYSRIATMLTVISQILLTMGQPIHAAADTFSYLALDSTGEGRITSIDPVAKTSSTRIILDLAGSLFASWVSPSHEWILLDYWPQEEPAPMQLRLLNLHSGLIRDVNLNTDQILEQSLPDEAVSWSPDSQYIAMSISLNDSHTLNEADLYSVADARLIKLKSHQTIQAHFAWSSDSSLLAIEGTPDSGSGGSLTIEIIGARTNVILQSLDHFGSGDPYFGICNLEWSPDKRYIAFISACEALGKPIYSEVYMWNWQTNTLFEATSLSTRIFTELKPWLLSSRYTLNWLSPTQLLVGIWIDYHTLSRPETAPSDHFMQTILYNPASRKISIFSAKPVQEISLNPISHRFAMLLIPSFDQNSGAPVGAQVKTGTLDNKIGGTSLDKNVSLPVGSKFFWSPDGKMLAYQKAASNDFVFVTDGDPPVVSYTFSDSSIATDMASKTLYVLPIGWGAG